MPDLPQGFFQVTIESCRYGQEENQTPVVNITLSRGYLANYSITINDYEFYTNNIIQNDFPFSNLRFYTNGQEVRIYDNEDNLVITESVNGMGATNGIFRVPQIYDEPVLELPSGSIITPSTVYNDRMIWSGGGGIYPPYYKNEEFPDMTCHECDQKIHNPEMVRRFLGPEETEKYIKFCEKEGTKPQLYCCECFDVIHNSNSTMYAKYHEYLSNIKHLDRRINELNEKEKELERREKELDEQPTFTDRIPKVFGDMVKYILGIPQ